MKNLKLIALFILVVLLFSSCAHQVDVSACVEGTKEYGFWNGLWHGMIAPFTFIGHLFNHEIAIFATNLKGSGGWYYFGFLMGISSSMGGGTKVVYRKK